MASSINFTSIDENYPVAGIDNDSQGFRDNFTFIKNSLQAAKSEIETLQNTTAKVNAENIFNGNNIVEANLINITEEKYEAEADVGVIVSIPRGGHQKFITNASVLCTFTDWPDNDQYSKVRVCFVRGEGISTTLTISFSAGAGTIYYSQDTFSGTTITLNHGNPVYVDAWTDNRGQSVYLTNLGQFISV